MSRIMFVTPALYGVKPGGREFLSRLHYDCLKDIYGDRLTLFELERTSVTDLASGARALRGYIDGITPKVMLELVEKAQATGVSTIFFNGSNLGLLAREAKKHLPAATVLTFFHNVEARFFLGSFRRSRSVRALSVAVANYIAERAAVRFSERRIALSARDSDLLQRLYGRAATDLVPMALHDKLSPDSESRSIHAGSGYFLFVGGAFYANEAGIIWFADRVVPHIQAKIVVVGQGMEKLRSRLEAFERVQVIGEVDDLSPWYLGATAVIAPIFDGSGMKTKVAEALMFGKRVIGTAEAFTGYAPEVIAAGWECRDARDFIAAIEEASRRDFSIFSPDLRSLYERYHSPAAARAHIAEILDV